MIFARDRQTDRQTDRQPAFQKIVLDIQEQKCELYNPTPSEDMSVPPTIPVTSEGMKILGVPVGRKEFISQVCVDIAQDGANLCHQLVSLDTQEAMLLLRFCHTPRLFYLARGVQPECLQSAAIIQDQQTRSTFSQLLHNADITGCK